MFWSDVLKAWSGYRYFNPVKFKDILYQPLWYNSFVKKANGNLLYYNRWFNARVIYVKDILNENYDFKSYEEMRCQYGLYNFIEYLSVVSSIPKEWKNLLKEHEMNRDSENVKSFMQFLDVFCNKKKITKVCYNVFVCKHVTKIEETNQQLKWEKEIEITLLNNDLWDTRFETLYKSTLDNKLRNFQFKFIHRRIATEKYLYDIKQKDTPLCNICKEEIQTMNHLFIVCRYSYVFWRDISQWLLDKGILLHPLSKEEICFGYCKKNYYHLVNTIILSAKLFIYANKYKDSKPRFNVFHSQIQHLEEVEKCIAFTKGKLIFHNMKWSPLRK